MKSVTSNAQLSLWLHHSICLWIHQKHKSLELFFSNKKFIYYIRILTKVKFICFEKSHSPFIEWGSTGPDFWDNSKNTAKIGFFGFCNKKKSPLMCRFFEFKLCTIMTFMIPLKLHVVKKNFFSTIMQKMRQED